MGIACFFGRGGSAPPDEACPDSRLAGFVAMVDGFARELHDDGTVELWRVERRMRKQSRSVNRLEREIRARKKSLAVPQGG